MLPSTVVDVERFNAAAGRDLDRLFDAQWYLAQYPEVAAAGIDPLVDYLTAGAYQGRDPNPLFNTRWYLSEYPEVASAGINPLVDYICFGADRGCDPNPLFDTDWYLARYPDVAASGMNPLADYLYSGAGRGRDPHPLFHGDWYVRNNPDLLQTGMNPLAHYLHRGAAQGCDPNPLFDTSWYLAVNPTLDRATNPLHHYILTALQGVSDPHPLFWNNWYLARYDDVRSAGVNPLIDFLQSGATCPRDPNPLFDSAWYVLQYPDVAASGTNPLVDYLETGAAQGRNPNAFFDGDWYLDRYPDVRLANLNPLDHYLNSGGREGRDPSHKFKTSVYLRQLSADEKAECTNPLAHFLSVGRSRDLRINEFFDPHVHGAAYAAFAAAASDKRPIVLMISHNLGGGTEKHIADLHALYRHDVNILMLRADIAKCVNLHFLDNPSDTMLHFDLNDQWDCLLRTLRQCAIGRIHIHHIMNSETYVYQVLEEIGVPFDVTLHDYYLLAPQPFLIGPDEKFVGEDLYAHEKKLIEASLAGNRPKSLHEWHSQHERLLTRADRIIAPSKDMLQRMKRYFPQIDGVVAAHPSADDGVRAVKTLFRPGQPLRVAMLGAVYGHKGLKVLHACVDRLLRSPGPLEFIVIGCVDSRWDRHLRAAGVTITGEYVTRELPLIVEELNPHLIWFPTQCPESFSYTLSEAVQLGLPIAAGDLGAIGERARGRPWSWVLPWNTNPEAWIRFFYKIREQNFRTGTPPKTSRSYTTQTDLFYKRDYLSWARLASP